MLCAIANIGPGVDGGLFIGVADDKKDADRIQQLDAIQPAHISSRYVVGVDRELRLLNLSLEQYKLKIVHHISQSALSEPLRSAVLAKIDCITYRGLSVICLWVPPQTSYSSIDDRVFVRKGSSTEEAKGARALNSVFERFKT